MSVKDIERAFPLWAEDRKAKASGEADVLDQVKATAGAEYATRIAGYFTYIDESNNSLQQHYRAALNTFNCSPCDLDAWLARQISAIRDQVNLFQQRRLQLAAIKQLLSADLGDAPRLDAWLREFEIGLRPQDPHQSVSAAIVRARGNAARWKGPADDS